ncbi:cilia- and flagella-associated protein 300-like [Tubulanus polymorphus]|uniref:cilia- and flagella-associated protein 300-like n=1 Tax=Tubulanus polymorphus TaxID=672921 RepID=UPI003DA4F14C
MAALNSSGFKFNILDGKTCSVLENKDNQEFFMKWGIKGKIRVDTFAFDQHFQPYQIDEFTSSFMKDDTVVHRLQVPGSRGNWVSLGLKADKVLVTPVECTITSMDFFDRLVPDVVRESGHIRKCLDEVIDSFTVSDELRKMLLSDESDHYDLFSDEDRGQFVFLLFKHLCLGGEVCQYEDDVTPYLDTAKSLYKDLISVVKDGDSKKLRVISHVYKFTAYDESGDMMYPADEQHDQNFAYLIIDPYKRHVAVLYHKFTS